MNIPKLLLIALIIGILTAVGAIFNAMLADEVVYATRGETVEARVLSKTAERSRSSGPGNGNSTGYYVTYEFVVDGRTYQKKDMLDVGRGYDDLKSGQVIDVVYDPSSPQTSRTQLSKPVLRYLGISIFVLAMAGLIGFFPFIRLRRAARTHALRKDCLSGEARITHPVRSSVKINNKNAFKLRYAFRDGHGVEREGKTCFLYWNDVDGYKEGSTVAVRYDRSNPKVSAIEPEFRKLSLA